MKNVELLDVLGAAAFVQETEVFRVRLASLEETEENKEPIVIFIKAKGNHDFAEDGGKLHSLKKGGPKGGKGKFGQWNKWSRGDEEDGSGGTRWAARSSR